MIKQVRKDFYWWRLLATACSFTLFGLGGLVLSFVFSPLLNIIYRDNTLRKRKARCLVQYVFKSFIGFMRFTGIYTYSMPNQDQLGLPGQLILANHPSLIDIVFLISRIPNANCIVKASLFSNPFIRGVLVTAGYIPNDDPEKIIELAAQSIACGESLVLFPEGTRSIPGREPRFQRGAAYIALRAKVTPTLVTIHCNPPMLMKNTPWYSIPISRPHFQFQIYTEKQYREPPNIQETPVAARKITKQLKTFFLRSLQSE